VSYVTAVTVTKIKTNCVHFFNLMDLGCTREKWNIAGQCVYVK